MYCRLNSIHLLAGLSSSVNIFTFTAVPLLPFTGFKWLSGCEVVINIAVWIKRDRVTSAGRLWRRHVVKSLSALRRAAGLSIWDFHFYLESFSFVIQQSLGQFMHVSKHHLLKYWVRCPQCALEYSVRVHVLQEGQERIQRDTSWPQHELNTEGPTAVEVKFTCQMSLTQAQNDGRLSSLAGRMSRAAALESWKRWDS